ncbi:MAG: hypothetical protein RL557_871 [archaeon]|jgi:hypothetical protein
MNYTKKGFHGKETKKYSAKDFLTHLLSDKGHIELIERRLMKK